ncbi:hypothetical protein PG995_010597 [Apiospora arundinis]
MATKLVTVVDMKGFTIASSATMAYGPGKHLHALAIMYRIPAITGTRSTSIGGSSTSGSDVSRSSSDASSSASGVATGIGIGVGIGVAVVLAVAAAVFWMFRQRRNRTKKDKDTRAATTGEKASTAPACEENGPREMNGETKGLMAMSISPSNGATTTTPPPGGSYPVVPGRHEMDVPHGQTELPAWSGRLSQ